jgi:N-acetyl sugar amidotransferase
VIKKYQICARCVMDTSDPDIRFDSNGICNHCREYEYKIKVKLPHPELRKERLQSLIQHIKEKGKEAPYDCIIGVSGGLDSTYLVFLTKQWGLRPLAFHLDNGWNTEIANSNMKNLLDNLGIDLYTFTANFDEFRDLQLAYLKASVLDFEVPSDHGIFGALYKVADEKNIKTILNGGNRTTEQIIPKAWRFTKNDLTNLLAIHRAFGTQPLKSYPTMGVKKLKHYIRNKHIEMYSPLNYVEYNKSDAISVLEREINWTNYVFKHGESIITKFYQGYILPTKFNIDKRKAHLSSLICAGQMSREEALEIISEPPYNNKDLKNDYESVLQKFRLSDVEFQRLMQKPIRSHFDFPTDFKTKFEYKIFPKLKPIWELIEPAVKRLKQ